MPRSLAGIRARSCVHGPPPALVITLAKVCLRPCGGGSPLKEKFLKATARQWRESGSVSIFSFIVIPAKAGMPLRISQWHSELVQIKGLSGAWIPAFAGMTVANHVTKIQTETPPRIRITCHTAERYAHRSRASVPCPSESLIQSGIQVPPPFRPAVPPCLPPQTRFLRLPADHQ